MELDKADKQEKKCPREGTRNRDPLFHRFRIPIKTLNWKPSYICKGPGAVLCQRWGCCFSLCEFISALVTLVQRVLFSWCAPSPLSPKLFLPPLPWGSLRKCFLFLTDLLREKNLYYFFFIFMSPYNEGHRWKKIS